MAGLKTRAELAVQLLVWSDAVTDENRISGECLHYRIDSAVLQLDKMYIAYSIKIPRAIGGNECNMCSNTFFLPGGNEYRCNVACWFKGPSVDT